MLAAAAVWASTPSSTGGASIIAPLAATNVATASPTPVLDDEYTARGTGAFRIGHDADVPLSRAKVDIDDRDRFALTLTYKDGTTVELKGRASGSGHMRQLKFVHGLGNKELSGSGDISFSDNNGRLINATGAGRVDGKQFSFEFEAGRSGGGDPDQDDRHSFSDSVAGRGRFDVDNEKLRLTHMRVSMHRNGDLSVTIESPDTDDIHWEGTWTGDGPEYRVSFHRAGVRNVTAEGTLTLSRNKKAFKKIEVDGKAHGDFAHLYFEAN